MHRLLATLLFTTLSVSSIAIAQDGLYHAPGHGGAAGHWGHPIHTPDLVLLDQLSDRLAKLGEHLHQDAHQLSQDYQHSASIEAYVDQLDQLQQHMHAVLHQSTNSGFHRSAVLGHIRSDAAMTKQLLGRLYRELQHQGMDGARESDFHRIAHMRQIIVNEVFPLVQSMESELYGLGGLDNHHQVFRRPSPAYQPSVQSRSVTWRGFRFSF